MTFLQPILLAALPLVALPIIIHLIHRQRHRTVPWAAMMFLLDARRMARGMARLRYWLIMAMRMLAIAALLFAASRPLASGRVGLAIGGQADTVIILLDRSASMQQRDRVTQRSKCETAIDKLSDLLNRVHQNSRIVLIENTRVQPIVVDDLAALRDLPDVAVTDTTADIPALVLRALEYVVDNQTGRTDIWICSDLQSSNWQTDDSRWVSAREGFEPLTATRFFLLTYPEIDEDNLAVRVDSVYRRQIGRTAELVLDLTLTSQAELTEPREVSLELLINGARSVIPVTMSQAQHSLQGHSVSIDNTVESGWGKVAIPGDDSPQDDQHFFVFAESPVHHTVIVAEDEEVAEIIRIAVTAAPESTTEFTAESVSVDRIDEIDWNATSLLVWQAPLPDADRAELIGEHVARGRSLLLLPPKQPSDAALFGLQWRDWVTAPAGESMPVGTWRGDADILRHANSGEALPIGRLRTFRACRLEGEATKLASLSDGLPLVSRAVTTQGQVYALSTLPTPDHSSLAQDGVAFYILLHRALAAGAASQGRARMLDAGSLPFDEAEIFKPLSPFPDGVLSSARSLYAGALESDQQLIALNRSEQEDSVSRAPEDSLAELLEGLDYQIVADKVGSDVNLASEIWRAFLVAMIAALLAEALLCLPEARPTPVEGVAI